MDKYYHGGRGGMNKGQLILPPAVTGATSQAKYGNYLTDKNRVYITTDYEAAMLYAAGVNGDVYEVEPVGELLSDPDCSQEGLSFSCGKAKIIKRYKLSDRSRRMVIKALIG